MRKNISQNYKETVNSLHNDEEVALRLNAEQCDCTNSTFVDPHQKYLITGDLRVIKNNELNALLTTGLNYWKSLSINFSKAFSEIKMAVGSCIENITRKNKINKELFQNQKGKMFAKVN